MARDPLTTGNPTRQLPREHATGQAAWASVQTCQSGRASATANDAIRCARQTLPDPTSLAPILLTIAAGILIIGGALTMANKGPAALLKPRSRSRREVRRLQGRRRIAGLALIGAGIGSLLMIVILAVSG